MMALLPSSSLPGTTFIALNSQNPTLFPSPAFPLHSLRPIVHGRASSFRPTPILFPTTLIHNSNNSFVTNATPIPAGDLQTLTPISDDWPEFADRVSGEWDGFAADFTPQGAPIELPESVVPEAYREWEVKVHDWQTQCPTLARPSPEPDRTLSYTTIKLLPTVGCEADAATRYTSDERAASSASAFAYHSSGSYVAAWPGAAAAPNKLELENCFVNPQDRESRVRILLALNLVRPSDENPTISLEVAGIRVFREQWYGPFRNGDQLGGCAIRDTAFAATAPLDPAKLLGFPWRRGPTAVAAFQHHHQPNGLIQQLSDGNDSSSLEKESLVRDASGGVVLLPKQIWYAVKENWCEVGWLFDDGKAVTCTSLIAPDATLKEVRLAQETAVLEGDQAPSSP
ncbi:unnamed protein product [Linum tenue]|uniref:Uncharacterized protein n=1 Tax=Linum tenue TaxID=586396 RepID=A0AAV0PJN0_9ROSI|nr:unnamed protein product [Linum tenue]